MNKAGWIWMPHPGHFIAGHKCRFKLNTYVGKYIVSTVGELHWENRQVQEIHAQIYDPLWLKKMQSLKGDYFDAAYMERFGYEDIGLNRKYETMVFTAEKASDKCCPWRIIVSDVQDADGYNEASDAMAGHMKLCNKYSKK